MSEYYDLLDDLARQHVGEIEAGRLELHLWVLAKGHQRAVARTRRRPAGIELIVVVDGDLHAAEAFTPAAVEGLDAAATRYRDALLADGWTEAGPAARRAPLRAAGGASHRGRAASCVLAAGSVCLRACQQHLLLRRGRRLQQRLDQLRRERLRPVQFAINRDHQFEARWVAPRACLGAPRAF